MVKKKEDLGESLVKYFKHETDRRQFLKGASVAGLSIFLGPLLSACSSSGGQQETSPKVAKKALVIRHATTYTKDAEDKYQTMGTYKFKELVETLSNGEMTVEVFPADQLGTQREVAEKLQAGVLEVAQTSTMNMSQFVPVLNILDFPYIFSSREQYAEIMSSDVVSGTIREMAEAKGIRPLWYYFNAFRHFCHRGDLIARLPSDLKGVKVRTTAGAIEQHAFRTIGAAPAPLEWGETYTAMQQGVVEALHAGGPPLYTSKIYETVKTITNINMMTDGGMQSASAKWYQSLSADQKKVIDEAALGAAKYAIEAQAKNEKAVVEELKKSGIKIYDLTPNELKVWRETVGHNLPVWDQLKKDYGMDVYNALAKLLSS